MKKNSKKKIALPRRKKVKKLPGKLGISWKDRVQSSKNQSAFIFISLARPPQPVFRSERKA